MAFWSDVIVHATHVRDFKNVSLISSVIVGGLFPTVSLTTQHALK